MTFPVVEVLEEVLVELVEVVLEDSTRQFLLGANQERLPMEPRILLLMVLKLHLLISS